MTKDKITLKPKINPPLIINPLLNHKDRWIPGERRDHFIRPRGIPTRPAHQSSSPAQRSISSRKPVIYPPFNSDQYLSNITSNSDPVSIDYLCKTCLPTSFETATFASGTHALAIYMNQDKLADAIFAAKMAVEVHQLTRQFPTDLGNWNQ